MNRIEKKYSFFILFLAIFITFIITGVKVRANEISLEEALNWGMENNSSIKEIKDSIESTERNLNLITIGERQNLKNRRTEILITNYENAPNLFS